MGGKIMVNRAYKREQIEGYIKNSKANLAILNAILPVLERFEGKVMNKRLATAITKETGITASFTKDMILQHLTVWRTNYNDSLRLFLGYTGRDTKFTMEMFYERNPGITKYQEWIDGYEIALTKLDGWCERLEVIERLKKELEAEADEYGVSGIMREGR
jgi:hypothetical protein